MTGIFIGIGIPGSSSGSGNIAAIATPTYVNLVDETLANHVTSEAGDRILAPTLP